MDEVIKDQETPVVEPQVDEPSKKLVDLETLTLEELRSLIDKNDTFKGWLNAEKDSHFSKSLNTWKENNLGKEVEKELSKRIPAETPEQKQIREMQLKLEKMEYENNRKELTAKALKLASEKQLDAELVDFVIADSEESTVARMSKLENILDGLVNRRVEEKYRASASKPATSTSDAIMSEYDKCVKDGNVTGMLKHKLNNISK